jgi:ketosteroid isomerase-like protein
MIYRAIVRHQVRSLFNQANEGNWAAIVDGLAPKFVYRFVGDTPLGGTRRTHEAMRLWFERLYRLFPGSQFAPQTIVVEGPPWKTNVMTYVLIRGSVPDESNNGRSQRAYENEFMQHLVLRWGKVTSVLTLEDTQRFVDLLPTLAAAGNSDASGSPIEDAVPALSLG